MIRSPDLVRIPRSAFGISEIHLPSVLELFKKLACRTRDEDSAANVTFTVLHSLHDASRFAAFGAVGALGGIHDFLAISGLGDLGHGVILS